MLKKNAFWNLKTNNVKNCASTYWVYLKHNIRLLVVYYDWKWLSWMIVLCFSYLIFWILKKQQQQQRTKTIRKFKLFILRFLDYHVILRRILSKKKKECTINRLLEFAKTKSIKKSWFLYIIWYLTEIYLPVLTVPIHSSCLSVKRMLLCLYVMMYIIIFQEDMIYFSISVNKLIEKTHLQFTCIYIGMNLLRRIKWK